MSQLVQVAQANTAITSLGQRAAAQNDRVLVSDFEFDRIASGNFSSILTDLGPGLLATAPINLSTLNEAGLQAATFSLPYSGVVRTVSALVTTAASTAGKLASVGAYIVGTGGTNEVDTLTITGAPAGGNFTVTVGGVTSGNVAFNASGATLQTALEAMSNIAVGDVSVTGGAGGPYVVTWARTWGSQPVTLTLANTFTGGTSPTITAVKTTPGAFATVGQASPTAVNGGVVALTTANAQPAGTIVPGSNVIPASLGAPNPNVFVAGSTLALRVVGTPTTFVEGAVCFLVHMEPQNGKSQPVASGSKSNWP